MRNAVDLRKHLNLIKITNMKIPKSFFALFLLILCLFAGAVHAQDNNGPTDSDTPVSFTGAAINIYQDTTNNIISSGGRAAFGNNNTVWGIRCFAFGDRNNLVRETDVAFAFGADNYLSGSYSACLGRNDSVTGSGAFAMGRFLSQRGSSNAILLGSGLASDARLVCDSANRLVVGFRSTRPTLTVTAAANNYGQGVTDKTGRVAIGDVASPQAKFHIRSDAGEDAVILVEPMQHAVNGAVLRLKDASHCLLVDSDGAMELSAGNHPLSLVGSNFSVNGAVLRLKDTSHCLLVDNDGAMELSAGNHPLSLVGNNFSVNGSQIRLGAMMEPRLVLYTRDHPVIYSNAVPSRDALQRPIQAPSYAIEFDDDALLFRTSAYQIPRDGDTDATEAVVNWSDVLSLGTDGRITLNGSVGVNAENTYSDYALAVNGGVIATAVRVKLHEDWPDYVFDEDYPLMTAEQLESYIREHRHLPGMPSAEEVREGYDVAEMQTALLRKVEELTLYTLRQQELIEQLMEQSRRQQRLIDRMADTVRFAYDACGNRVGRIIEFSRLEEDLSGRAAGGGETVEWLPRLDDRFDGGAVSLFPNPTEGCFTLTLPGGDSARATATLLTLSGTVLETRVMKGSAEVFDLSAQPAGLYLLRLSTEKETRTWKVVKRN